MLKTHIFLLDPVVWQRVRVSQELCNDIDPLKAMKTNSKNIPNGIQECQEEAKTVINKNANFIVFLLRADASGNNCFIYEKCDDRNLKRILPGISFQIR